MSLSDPIADMLTRLRNAGRVGMSHVKIRSSKVCRGIAKVLQEEGYIEGYDVIDDGQQGVLRIALKYSRTGGHAISAIRRVSKPGCRVYRGKDNLPDVLGGLGIVIVSTSKGVISDRKCRQDNIGGEVLCTVS
ncbi:MAG: 30S ribosomal protein S8 [Sedimentisphaerales bacterium]|nr:30S ribosomal protein S8 [Sedimentisphaerales bacterium]